LRRKTRRKDEESDEHGDTHSEESIKSYCGRWRLVKDPLVYEQVKSVEERGNHHKDCAGWIGF